MMQRMGNRIAGRLVIALLSILFVMPSVTMAARQQEQQEVYDARYEGYAADVNVKSPGTGGAYFLMALLGVICVGVMFKDARRTHLD